MPLVQNRHKPQGPFPAHVPPIPRYLCIKGLGCDSRKCSFPFDFNSWRWLQLNVNSSYTTSVTHFATIQIWFVKAFQLGNVHKNFVFELSPTPDSNKLFCQNLFAV